MLKVLITLIFIFLAFGVVSISIMYQAKDSNFADLNNINNIVEPKCLSIKEIQKLTAQSNYHFTVVNMVQWISNFSCLQYMHSVRTIPG